MSASEEERTTPPSDAPKVPACDKGHGTKEWCECWQCNGEGLHGHECGEDCCVCLDPEDNERCDICNGGGGWWRCYTCAPVTEEEEL